MLPPLFSSVFDSECSQYVSCVFFVGSGPSPVCTPATPPVLLLLLCLADPAQGHSCTPRYLRALMGRGQARGRGTAGGWWPLIGSQILFDILAWLAVAHAQQ
jgi:hypothetical protein